MQHKALYWGNFPISTRSIYLYTALSYVYFCVNCFPAQVSIATLLGAEGKWRLKEYAVSECYAYNVSLFFSGKASWSLYSIVICSDLPFWNFIEVLPFLQYCGFQQSSNIDLKLESEIGKKTTTLKGDSVDEWNTTKAKCVNGKIWMRL